jgi:hypothetical protein
MRFRTGQLFYHKFKQLKIAKPFMVNQKRNNGNIPLFNSGDNEPNNNGKNLFITMFMCVCVYSISKNK